MTKLTDLLREKNYRQTVKKMERTSKSREDLLCEMIDRHEKICYRCRHFYEHRIPEHVIKYGEFTGRCLHRDEGSEGSRKPDVVTGPLIVNAESVCEKFVRT